ncbi:MAG: homoserine dehydrogenase [Gemmatimonadaceae bacterium]
MSLHRIAFLGYGTVGRALHALMNERGVDCEVVGIASRRGGWRAGAATCAGIDEWLATARPDVVFEAIALDPHSGEPALGYIRSSLEHGAHVVSANKGPVVHGYRELSALAERVGRKYRFESAVMDGAPVFSLVRECLPMAGLRAVSGVFTSTATIVLEAVESGGSVADGVAHAQALGIAEADPSYDVDGWDSAVKLCALGNVLLGLDLRPDQVSRVGVEAVPVDEVRRARAEGARYRLIGEVSGGGARVMMRCCTDGDPFAVSGTTLVTHFEAEVFPGGLTVTSRDPDPMTTAYGMLADYLRL